MPTTSNFGWTTPADTDLVKDGAAAIRTLGNGIDTSFIDLKGGTTGQVLAKASNTDLDFTWSADASGIPATIFDAKGDLIAASAADTAARLAVGANDTVLTADSSTATGLKWATPASGGMTSLATGSLTGSSVSITSIAATYVDLRLVLTDWYPSTDDVSLQIGVNNTTGIYIAATSVNSAANTYGATRMQLSSTADNSDRNNYAMIEFFDYTSAVEKFVESKFLNGNAVTATDRNFGRFQGGIQLTSAINRIDIALSSGNFGGGTYTLYGVK